jgi:tape measure domain-containing protein
MATAELVIAFDARADKLEASLKRVTTKLNELESKVGSTGNAVERNTGRMAQAFEALTRNFNAFILAYAGFRGVEVIARTLVATNELNASIQRLGVLTNSSLGGAIDQFQNLSRVAASTGQPLDALTNQFTRFFTATASIGATREQVDEFVTSLANFSRLSAQGPQEAAAAITQLSQGLASGRLQGDELKSILENMPILATALAQELGVSVGELRKMGEEGRLSAENVFPAIIRAGANLSQRLEGLPLTLRQGWQVFRDSALAAIARVDQAMGASEWVSRLFADVGQRMSDATRRSYGTDVSAPMEIRAQNMREQIASNVRELNRLTALQRQLDAGQIPVDDRGREVSASRIREGIRQREARLVEQQRALSEVQDQLAERSRLEGNDRANQGLQDRIGQADNEARTIRESANPILRAERERDERLRALRTTLADRRAADTAGTNAASIAEFERQQREAIDQLFREAERSATSGDRSAAAGAQRRAEQARRQDDARALREARDRQAALAVIQRADRGTVRDIDAMLTRITTPAVGSTAGSPLRVAIQESVQLSEVFGALGTQAIATGTAVQRSGGDMAEVSAATARNFEALREALIREGANPEEVFRAYRAELDKVNAALRDTEANAKATWNAIAVQGVNMFANDLSGALVEFAATGEQKFDEMAANFLKNIAKMILQAQVLAAIQAGLGAGGLNLINFPRQKMSGGPVSAGQPYIVGERRPELFVPSSSGYIMPSVPTAGGTTVNVYNQAAGTSTRQQERSNGLGGKEIDIYIEEVVKNGMARGRYDGVMGQSFGASRRGAI